MPEAISALRYFREDMSELPVLAAGSLLDFALADHRFSMPVGRVANLHMGPMVFTEFLNAVDEGKLAFMIASFEFERGLDPAVHNRIMDLLRIYFFTGGMPEAVNAFARSRRLRDVGVVHNSIVDTYREDFPKYIGSRSLPRIVNVFNFAARNVGTEGQIHPLLPGGQGGDDQVGHRAVVHGSGVVEGSFTATATVCRCRRMATHGCTSSSSWMLA